MYNQLRPKIIIFRHLSLSGMCFQRFAHVVAMSNMFRRAASAYNGHTSLTDTFNCSSIPEHVLPSAFSV